MVVVVAMFGTHRSDPVSEAATGPSEAIDTTASTATDGTNPTSTTAPPTTPTTSTETTEADTTTTTQPEPAVPASVVPRPDGGGPIWPGPWQVALTFDDGPDPTWTQPILDVLARYNVPATFFVIGSNAAKWPDLVTAMANGGHSVQNHTWGHPYMTGLGNDGVLGQLGGANDIVTEITGKRPTCWRPPYGNTDARVDQLALDVGLPKVMWNVAPNDYLSPPPEAIVANVMERAAALVGGPLVVVLHDGGGVRANTLAALPGMIESLTAGGFTFVSLC